MKQTKYQLKNKMKVLLIESKKSPVISVQMWVKTGSADEKKNEEGISHFIEHLVFKGTEKYKVGEIANIVEASGGELNAYTSFDQTVFYVTISKNFKEVALDVVSQMMGFPTFDPAEVDSEREVVCEEIKMGQDSPGRKSSQLLFSSTFKKHAYSIPVIGYDKNVRSWSVKKIKDYYHSRYVPSNMFLVVSGDFETKDMKAQVESYFGGFKPYKLRKVKRVKEPVQKKYQYKTEKYKIQDRHLHLSFKAPNARHKDIAALDVLATVLGHGDSSRLVQKLRLEKTLVSSVSAFNYNPQDEGLFAISAHYQGDHDKQVVEEILNQVGAIQNKDVTWSDIKRARVSISSEQFYSIETVDGLANKAGNLEFYYNDQNAQKKYLNQLNKITPKDVKKAAKKYLQLNKLSASFLGDVDKNKSEQLLKELPALWKKSVKSEKVKPEKNKKVSIPKLILKPTKLSEDSQIEKITRDSGIIVLFKKSKDTPTVSSKFVFRGGARLETPETMGLSELATRVWISSTPTRSEAQLMQELEESAIELSPFSGKNTTGFSLSYLSAFEKKALGLATDAILNTEFDQNIVEREKTILFQAIKSREDHPSSRCVRQFLKTIYGNHPLSYEAAGTNETLKNINHKMLLDLKKKILNSKNLTISVVGDFNKAEWLKSIEQLEQAMSQSESVQPKHAIADLNENKEVFSESDKEQSHVIVGWRGLTLTHPDRYTLQIIEAILSGQGGRLFFELRDKNSLAYSVSPLRMESIETGYFGGYIACSHEKVNKAIEMFMSEFKKLTTDKVSKEELDRAKRYLIGQHDIGLQKKSAFCNMIAFDEVYGNNFNESLNVANEYNKVTPEKITELAKKLFTKPYVISIVGKKDTATK